MALTPRLCVASRNLSLNAALDTPLASGSMRWYDGTQPTDSDTALGAQVLLATLPLSATAFAAASSGSKAANSITSASAVATSTATWGSLVTSGNVRTHDFSIGTSGANLNLNSVAISSGATCSCSSFTETMAI